LEKDQQTGKISYDPANHAEQVENRRKKIEAIAKDLPLLEVQGDADADTLVIGWGGTYGHLLEATKDLQKGGKKIAMAHFQWINPLPLNTEKVLRSYKRLIVAELNDGQFAGYLHMKFPNLPQMYQYNRVEGQPFIVEDLVNAFTKILED
jgi:2-oxoglutarate ferredoxin oxidoreductase subunit alpha